MEGLAITLFIIAFHAIVAFNDYRYKVRIMGITDYDKFVAWLVAERPGKVLTNHQHLVCEALLNGVTVESLGGKGNATGQEFALSLVNEWRAL